MARPPAGLGGGGAACPWETEHRTRAPSRAALDVLAVYSPAPIRTEEERMRIIERVTQDALGSKWRGKESWGRLVIREPVPLFL